MSNTAKADRTTLINERKLTSRNFAEWQGAIQLRDMVVLEAGNDCDAYRRATNLARAFYGRWAAEMTAIDVPVSASLMGEIERKEQLLMEMDAGDSVPQTRSAPARPVESKPCGGAL